MSEKNWEGCWEYLNIKPSSCLRNQSKTFVRRSAHFMGWEREVSITFIDCSLKGGKVCLPNNVMRYSFQELLEEGLTNEFEHLGDLEIQNRVLDITVVCSMLSKNA